MENINKDMIIEDGPEWWLLAMGWTGWSDVSEANVRIGANIDEILLGGKPIMADSHHRRSTREGKTFLA